MQIIPIADEFVGAPVDVVIFGMRDQIVGRGGDGGGFAAGKGREIPDADVADEVPVGGAGKGVDIRGFDAEKADERLLLVGVVLILKRLENIARVAAVLGQKRNEVRFGKKLLKARGNGSGRNNGSPCRFIVLPIVSHNRPQKSTWMKSSAARAAILVMRRLTVLVNSCYDTKTNNHTMFVDAKGVTQTFFQRQAKDRREPIRIA